MAKKHPDALVLGADTVVYKDAKLFGKPTDLEDAYRMLKQLQGGTHQVVTGVCLLHLRGHRQKMFAESTDVKFRHLDVKAIKDYIKETNPLDKAGAYGIQDQGDKIVENVSGSYTNVVGLPVERLKEELSSRGCSGGKRNLTNRPPSQLPLFIGGQVPAKVPARDRHPSIVLCRSNGGRIFR